MIRGLVGGSSLEAAVPVGAMVLFAGDLSTALARRKLAERGWLVCDGKAKTTMSNAPELFAAIGFTYGKGPAAGQFALPDLRGQFMRGVADDASQDPGFSDRQAASADGTQDGVGSTQPCMVQEHVHAVTQPATATALQDGEGAGAVPTPPNFSSGLYDSLHQPLSGDETRPTNTYVYVLIKYSSRRRPVVRGIDLGL